MRNPIDGVVGFFSPRRGLVRMHHRQMLKRAYEGADSKGDGWRPRRAGASANTDHAMDGRELRNRSRALVQNVPYIAQGLRALVAQTVGGGIEPTWIGRTGDALNETWKLWVAQADAGGRQNYYGLQGSAYRAMEQDGEVLLRLRWRRPTDGLAVPLQLQLLEIDWLDSLKSGDPHYSGNSVVNGIEYDVLGRRAGYWMYRQHPGDYSSVLRSPFRNQDSHFVPASEVIHLSSIERPGQARGFPRISSVIARVRDLQVYEDAELARKNLEARLSVLASGDMSAWMTEPRTGDVPQDTREMGELAGGQLIQLPPGMSTTVVEPKAAPGYVDYVKWQLHLIAAGFGVPYEAMTGDMQEVNFSSARVRLIDFRREVEMMQWQHFIPNFCTPICRAFEDAAVLAGVVPRATYEIDHATPKWDYVNPQQDVRADVEEISSGLSSISEKLRRRGYKPKVVFEELAADIGELKRLGLLDTLLAMRGRKSSVVNTEPATD